jgi:ribose-phosphate pyrophosphokinase
MAKPVVLNLAYPDKSDIRFKVSKFPDGQQSITIESTSLVWGSDVTINSRLSTFRDLELIICANKALRENAASKVSLYSPWFIGARSDRKFEQGSTNYLKNVICPIINSQNFDKVTVLDPHSDVLEACLNNYSKINNFKLVKFALTNIDNKNDARERIVLVSPDGGALKKIYDVAEHFQISDLVTAIKHRDIKTGKITHTEVPLNPLHASGKKFVIVDDICDGGRTFVELAKAIIQKTNDCEIYLIVTHGVFSAGFDELSKYFKRIYSTNSYSDYPETDILTQYNIFK